MNQTFEAANRSLKLTARDLELARVLARSVRYMTIDQITRCWWPGASDRSSTAEKRLRKLVAANWLGSSKVFVRPVPEIVEPIRKWKSGDPKPNAFKDSWKAKSRWQQAPRTTVVYYAGRKAAHNFLGKKPRQIKQPFQIAHDLGVAEVFTIYYTERPSDCAMWIGEIEMPRFKKSKKRPDAAIGKVSSWPPVRVVEFAGCYSADRLLEFHQFCKRQGMPYELW